MSRSPQQQLVDNNNRLYDEMVIAIRQFLNLQQQRDANLAQFAMEYELSQQKDTTNNNFAAEQAPQEQSMEVDEQNWFDEFVKSLAVQFGRDTLELQTRLLNAIALAAQNGQIAAAAVPQMQQVVKKVLQPLPMLRNLNNNILRMVPPPLANGAKAASAPTATAAPTTGSPFSDDDAEMQELSEPLRQQVKSQAPSAPSLNSQKDFADVVKATLYKSIAVEATRTTPGTVNQWANFFKIPGCYVLTNDYADSFARKFFNLSGPALASRPLSTYELHSFLMNMSGVSVRRLEEEEGQQLFRNISFSAGN